MLMFQNIDTKCIICLALFELFIEHRTDERHLLTVVGHNVMLMYRHHLLNVRHSFRGFI